MFQKFSPNMLKTYKQCPKKFYFRFVKNISMPMNDEVYELGKNIHAIAAYYLKKEYIDKMIQSLSEEELRIWEYLRESVYFSYDVINTEYNLSVKVGEYFFGGRLDALVKNEETYYILDYKTGSAPRDAKYDFQTMIYLLAVRAFFKTDKVVFVYLDLKNKTELRIPLSQDVVEEYEKQLLVISERIANEDYSFNTKVCPCEYNLICYH